MPTQRIDQSGTKCIGRLIEDAFNSYCTSTPGLYWLGPLKEYRPNHRFNVIIDTTGLSSKLPQPGLDIPPTIIDLWITSSRNSLLMNYLNRP